jgi:hypothetical protein
MKKMNFYHVNFFILISLFLKISNIQTIQSRSQNSKTFALNNDFGVANLENKILRENMEVIANEQIKKTNLDNKNNHAKKFINLDFDPLLEDESEKNKLINSKFLGPIIPKLEPEAINCKNLNSTSLSDSNILKICNMTSLIQLNVNQENSETPRINRGIQCDLDTCNPTMGVCSIQNECICEKGFVDDPNVSVNKYCSYKQKRQLLFFLIEFFAPFGLGHILNGRLFYGIIKCSIIVGIVLLDILSRCIIMCGSERGAKCPNYFSFFYYLMLVIWHAYDITMIGFNKFKEENNISFIPVEF